jgi:hypothetical protein
MITFIKGLIRVFGVLGTAALMIAVPILVIGDGIYGLLVTGNQHKWLEILAGTLFGCIFFGVDPSRILMRKKKIMGKTERSGMPGSRR